MLVDTHAHLNFKVFKSQVETVLESAYAAGVEQIICVGTQLKSSRLAVRQAEKFALQPKKAQVWATAGIHPHHVWDYLSKAVSQTQVTKQSLDDVLDLVLDQVKLELNQLIQHPRVVAVGEIGLDRHFYDRTQYQDKTITDRYLKWQRVFFIAQLEVARQAGKAVIIHNRESIDDLLNVFSDQPNLIQTGRMVLHCCESEMRLLEFAQKHQLFIGVDGDVTYDLAKQAYIQKVPLEMLVLETDSPFMVPEPDRSKYQELRLSLPYKDRVCQPRHIVPIAEQVASLKQVSFEQVAAVTTQNACRLFGLPGA